MSLSGPVFRNVVSSRIGGAISEKRCIYTPFFFLKGLALVNIEAMACGCKVVCSDIPGMKDWFEENSSGRADYFRKTSEDGEHR